MGIKGVFVLLKCGKRVPLRDFHAQYIEQGGEILRLEVDAYQLIFRSPARDNDGNPIEGEHDRDHFMCKIFKLVEIGVRFVVAFDGRFKPHKIRHEDGSIVCRQGHRSYDEEYDEFLKTKPSDYGEDNPFVDSLKRELDKHNIQWRQAAGDAEAECAHMQNRGKVHGIITDDSDALACGARSIFKDFSCYAEENVKREVSSADAKSQCNASGDHKNPFYHRGNYYVSIVTLETENGQGTMTREEIVFLAVLSGGDSSRGSEQIGLRRAQALAQCGAHGEYQKGTQIQDMGEFTLNTNLAQTVAGVFASPKRSTRGDTTYVEYSAKPPSERAHNLRVCEDKLNRLVSNHGQDLFGNRLTLKTPIRLEDYAAMHFLCPIVSREPFVFDKHSLSFGGSTVEDMCSGGNKIVVPRKRMVSYIPRLLTLKETWEYFTFKKTELKDGVNLISLSVDFPGLEAFLRRDPRFEFEEDLENEPIFTENEGSGDENLEKKAKKTGQNITVKFSYSIMRQTSPGYIDSIKGEIAQRELQPAKNSRRASKNQIETKDPNQPKVDDFFPRASPSALFTAESKTSNGENDRLLGIRKRKKNEPSASSKEIRHIDSESDQDDEEVTYKLRRHRRRYAESPSSPSDTKKTSRNSRQRVQGSCAELPLLVSSQDDPSDK